MSQKKCPKCGENNPAEAVMCWACYTPLAGGVTAATPHATAPASVGMGNNEGTAKKAVAPWQIGAGVVVALLAAVGIFGLTNRPSGGTDVSTLVTAPPPDVSMMGGGGSTIKTYDPSTAMGGGSSAPVTPAVAPTGTMLFTISLPPKDGVPWGTMAIVPSATASAQNPASLAAAASQQAMTGGKWDGLYVYVFADAASAQKFRQYQSGRGGQPLKASDYSALQDLWSQVPVRYEYRHDGTEAIRYPSKNPGSWWGGSSSFRRAKI